MMLPFAPSCFEELTALRNRLKSYREDLKKGVMPDMKGFDLKTQKICKRLQTSAKYEQNACLPELKQLLDDLDECARDVESCQVETSGPGQ